MATRYFAFGCSYVNWKWATLPDFISANFDQYYNYGQGGACNTYICDKLLEVDQLHRFNPDTDFVTVGITGFGRYSILDEEHNGWITAGDTLPAIRGHKFSFDHPPKSTKFANEFDSITWAIYRSWIAVRTISEFLKLKNIKHVIYASRDNLLWLQDPEIREETRKKAYEIIDMLTIKESIDEMISNKNEVPGFEFLNGEFDGHPNPTHNYNYFQKHFSDLDNDKNKEYKKILDNTFDPTGLDLTWKKFYQHKSKRMSNEWRNGVWIYN